jgi:REP element-mobilizing transposase RayT
MTHPRKPLRLSYYNYSANGAYFVTICTKNREHYFGEIKNDKMHLSGFGHLAKKYWEEIPNHFEDARLDIFVIMPNHIHGIVFLENEIDGGDVGAIINRQKNQIRADDIGQNTKEKKKLSQSNVGDADLRPLPNRTKELLPLIIHQFKSSVTRQGKRFFPHLPFGWQRSYHDRVIRNETELEEIREYIINNPLKWAIDEENI